jgi:hypothetical protein
MFSALSHVFLCLAHALSQKHGMIQRTTKKRGMIQQTTKKRFRESASALSAKALQTQHIQQSLLHAEKTGFPLLFDSSVWIGWITTLVPLAPSESYNSFGLVPVQKKKRAY